MFKPCITQLRAHITLFSPILLDFSSLQYYFKSVSLFFYKTSALDQFTKCTIFTTSASVLKFSAFLDHFLTTFDAEVAGLTYERLKQILLKINLYTEIESDQSCTCIMKCEIRTFNSVYESQLLVTHI